MGGTWGDKAGIKARVRARVSVRVRVGLGLEPPRRVRATFYPLPPPLKKKRQL